jgi:hypothetical protein
MTAYVRLFEEYSANMRPRRDYETAKLIDESLDALRFYGMYVAARILFEGGVKPRIAFRVLQEPDKRRSRNSSAIH